MPLNTSNIEDTITSREKGINRLLSSILNLNLQHELNEKHIISIINRQLSTAKHRKEGLEYLNIVIDNCSPSVIAENAINWLSHCIIKFSDDVLRELKLRILGKIIEVAHNESEFNKKFVSEYISKVLDNCTTTSHVNPYECKAALKTLTISMRYYPSSFGAQRQKIENFLLIFLDSEIADLVLNAGLAFHYLQQVGSAGSNGVNHKLNFTQSFHKLCRTVHTLYDVFFENETEIFLTERLNEDVFEFQDDPTSNAQMTLHINARRIRNVLKFIEILIKTKFPAAKETKPKELLEVITRGTSIHKCISGDSIDSLESYQFSLLLSEIQCTVLKLLRLFIIWYQANCLPFSYSISKIMVDCIERSHNCECFKYDSLYQESAYRALNEWLAISKSSLHPQFQSQLLVCILKDVTPVKNQITLTISEAATGKKSQKAKRKAMADRIIFSGNQNVSNDSTTHYEKNNEKNACKFALTTLRHLLELTRLNVKPDLLKDLYKSIFDSLTTIQSSKPLHPYTDVQCQAKLYEVLVAIYYQNTLSILPPLQTSLDVLTRGANDGNRFVSEVCQRGLRNLEILCQPICPSLYLGVEKEEEREEKRDVRDEIEIEEMDADESLSIDYDASTDEFSPNTSVQQNVNSSTLDVRQSNVDSTVHEELSDKDVSTNEYPQNDLAKREISSDHIINDERQFDTDPYGDDKLGDQGATKKRVRFEEPDATAQKAETDIGQSPTIIILSEDEALENETKEPEPLQTTRDDIQSICSSGFREEENEDCVIIEEIQEGDKSRKDDFAEDVEDTVPFEEVINMEKECENTNEAAGDENYSRKETEEQKSATGEPVNKPEQQVSSEESGITNEEQDKASSSGVQVESDEPPAKKAKLSSEEDLDMDDVFEEAGEKKEEGKEEDPDSSILEDDSFVDEVKDYY